MQVRRRCRHCAAEARFVLTAVVFDTTEGMSELGVCYSCRDHLDLAWECATLEHSPRRPRVFVDRLEGNEHG